MYLRTVYGKALFASFKTGTHSYDDILGRYLFANDKVRTILDDIEKMTATEKIEYDKAFDEYVVCKYFLGI